MRRTLNILFAVLIAICAAAMLLIAIKGTTGRDQPRTLALIKLLDHACCQYKVEYGVYPPMEPFADSRCLHLYLGKPGSLGGKTPSPIILFKPDMLDLPRGQESVDPVAFPPVPVIDVRGRKIQYKPFPGMHNRDSVDIWSLGKDERDPADDVTNWAKEF